MEREISPGVEEVAWEQGWWVGSGSGRTPRRQRPDARPLRETVSMATEARGQWLLLGGGQRTQAADGAYGDPRGSRKSVPSLASSSDTKTPSLFPSHCSGRGGPGRWAGGRKPALSRPRLPSCRVAPQPSALQRTAVPSPRTPGSEGSRDPQQAESSHRVA